MPLNETGSFSVFFLGYCTRTRTLNRRNQLREFVFTNIIRGSPFKCILFGFGPGIARKENKWNSRILLPNIGQRLLGIEIRELRIGNDCVDRVFLKGCFELFPGLRPRDLATNRKASQFDLDDFRDEEVILYMKNSQTLVFRSLHNVLLSW